MIVVVIVVFILCRVSFIVCAVLCAVFRLILVLFCVLCLIVLSLPPGKTPFAVKINNNNSVQFFIIYVAVDNVFMHIGHIISMINSDEVGRNDEWDHVSC
jgi:hypothetical protein